MTNNEESYFKTPKGINEEVVREISAIKQEPEWMLEYRLKALKCFLEKPMPTWGVDLSRINFDEYTYYIRPSDKKTNDWSEVPQNIKNTFDKLGIPEAEAKYLAGVTTQYESEVVYHNMLKEVQEKGVIFLDIDTGLKECPELFRKYFDTVIPYSDNKFSALNGAVWSGGSFIYVPPGVTLEKPLQSYFRINSEQMGQFERTLIIVDKGSDIHYVEGCTAPNYSKDSLHTGVVEIVVLEDAKCRYTTIQNWSTNILNLVTQRAKVYKNGQMEWVDGNIGSAVTMKYPTCMLMEEGAKGTCITIAVAGKNQIMDSGSKMIHLAPNTSSTIISKSISKNGGKVNYRGLVEHLPKALNAKSKVECDTLILDEKSTSDTVPTNYSLNNDSIIEHEATVSKISDDQLFYLMSRGLSKENATQMIVMGFIEPFSRELPMEYAVELNQLLKMDFGDSIG
ncbi:MAG: Fe-S cluster assembly protein SufB [Thomasclavelia sp.]|nr:Fe-S cluster assembly protein SufB [Thomasclavelia sp.]